MITVTYMVEILDDQIAVSASSDELPGYSAVGPSIDECRQLVHEYLRDIAPGTTIGREVLVDGDERPVSVIGAAWVDSRRIETFHTS